MLFDLEFQLKDFQFKDRVQAQYKNFLLTRFKNSM